MFDPTIKRISRIAGGVLLCLASAISLATSPAPGTRIYNQAELIFTEEGMSEVSVIPSNVSYINVGVWRGLKLEADQQLQAVAGQEVYFSHRLQNRGGSPDSYSLSVSNLGGDGGDLSNLRVYQDTNGNGKPDLGEKLITETAILAVDDSIDLVIAGTVPVDTASAAQISVQLNAVSLGDGSISASVSNSATLKTSTSSANIVLSKTSSIVCKQYVEPGDELTYSIEFNNVGTAMPAEQTIVVDGPNRTGVLIVDDLPYSVFLEHGQTPEFAPHQARFLVQRYVDKAANRWMSYELWNGVQPIDKVALLVPASQMKSNQAGSFSFDVKIAETATASTLFKNKATIDEDADGQADFSSNEVCNQIRPPQQASGGPGAPTVSAHIDFLRPAEALYLEGEAPSFENDSDYVDSESYRINNGVSGYNLRRDGVYIQVSSTTLTGDTYHILEDGSRQVVVSVESAGTGDVAQIALRETSPGSGVYRSLRALMLSTQSGNGDICPTGVVDGGGNPTGEVAPDYSLTTGQATPECTLKATNDDSLVVTLYDGGVGTILDDAAIVDPLGFVFDSVTRQPVAGAQVVVCAIGATAALYDDSIADDLCGALGEQAIDPFRFLDDGVNVPLEVQTTGADGFYQYPFMLAGDYYLVVYPPAGYSFPSSKAAANFPGFVINEFSYGVDGEDQVPGSEAGVFTLNAINDLVVVDLPIDPVQIDLAISSTCEAPGFLLGGDEQFSYSISYTNSGNLQPPGRTINLDGTDVTGVLVEDSLPFDKFFDSDQPHSPTPADSEVVLHLLDEDGDNNWISLSAWNGTDLVERVGVLIDPTDFGPGVTGRYQFNVRTAPAVTEGTRISNRIEVNLDGAGAAEFIADANECMATGPEAAIRLLSPTFELLSSGQAPDFYADDDFIDTGLYRLDDVHGDYNFRTDAVYVELNSTSIPTGYLNDPDNLAAVLDDGRRQLMVNLASGLTGDSVRIVVQETGYSSGIFRSIRPLLLSAERAANGAFCPLEAQRLSAPDFASEPPETCVLKSSQNDRLIAHFDDPGVGRVLEDAAIVDPLGVVFDTQTLQPVEGAVVTIFNADGSQAVDPLTGQPLVSQTVGADGFYQYPRLFPGDYYMEVETPELYSWPSTTSPAELTDSGYQVSNFSYGIDGFNGVANSGVFSLGVDNPLLVVDFPVDPGGNFQLIIEKSASAESVELGGLIEYSLRLANVGEGTVRNIDMIDDLPFGFRYVEDTLRVNGQLVDDPGGAPGPQLQIAVGDLDVEQEVTAAYVLQATAGAVDGDGINEAYAQGAGAGQTVVSNVDRVQVELDRTGVLSDKAFIFGKVYVDSDCNNIQTEAEWPIGGVKLYLENGTYAITDENGQFSIFGIKPGQHVIKLDKLTLPSGVQLKPLDNRHGADAGSRFVDLIEGDYHRADFAVACPSPEDLESLQAQLIERNENMQGDWMLEQALLFNPEQTGSTSVSDSALTSGVFGGSGAFDPNERSFSTSLGSGLFDQSESVASDELDLSDNGYPGSEELAKEMTADLAREGTWLWPQDGRSLSGRFVAGVRTGMTPYLFLNGEQVADSQLGEQIVIQPLNAQVLAWYGLKLAEGDNLLEVKARDPFGNMRTLVSGTFYSPGFAERLQLNADKDTLPADGGRSSLTIDVRMLDTEDRPARGVEFVTLEATDGSFVEPDIQESVPGHQIRVLNGQARVRLRSSERSGEVRVRATTGSFEDEMKLRFIASQRPLIVSGIASAGYTQCTIDHDGNTPTGSACENGDVSRRMAMFAKGQVRGGYFVTLSYDSEKIDEDLLRDMNPNEYYPIMGDNSVRGYEAQSRSKLYARIELDKNSLTWGDFTTDATNSYKDLSRVQRTLTGVEGVYDNGTLKLLGFAAQEDNIRKVVELEGNGTAMLYQIPGGDIVRNSEVVELLTMDREASGLVISAQPLQRFTDYVIDYVTGDIRFVSAIPSFDENLNPLKVRISYDQESGGDEELVAGARATLSLGDQVVVGGSYTTDENKAEGYEIVGGFAEIRPNEKSVITASVADMDHRDDSLKDGRGLYVGLEMTWDTGGRSNITWGRADVGFTNGNGVSAGREDYRASHQQQLTQTLTLDAEAIQGSELGTENQSNSYRVSMTYDVADWELTLGSRYLDQQTEAEQTTGTTIIAGAGRSFEVLGMQSRISTEYERETGNDNRERWQARYDSDVSDHVGIYGQVEQINSLSGIDALTSGDDRTAASFGMETDWLPSTSVYNEYRMRGVQDGRQLEAVTGVRGDYALIDGIKVTPNIEWIQAREGDAEDSKALSIGVKDTRGQNSRTNARLESRFDEQRDYYGMDISYVSRLNLDWSAFVQEDMRYSRLTSGVSEVDSTFTLGLARRPRLDNEHHMLFMYQWLEERGEGTLSDRTVHLLSTHQNWQPQDKWIISGRLGGKYERQPLLDRDFSSFTAVLDGRLIYDLSRRLDLDIHAGVIGTNSFNEARYSFGAGVNYLVNQNLRVGVGYNLIGFDEGDLDPQGFNQHGFYINMQYKFDEEIFNWLEFEAN